MAEDGQSEQPSGATPEPNVQPTSPPSQSSEIEVTVPLLNVAVEEKGEGNVVTRTESTEARQAQTERGGGAKQGV